MRPRTLDDFVGQSNLVGEKGALRRLVEHGRLASMVLWGPPGSGKTTLGRLLAEAVGARFATLSAVMSGVADVRAVIAGARDWNDRGGAPTVLFIDEIHRFNKGQQDALLPQVEDGTITLIGATTENPYFEVNSALLSRTRVYRLEALEDDEVRTVVERAIADERGFGGRVALAPKVLDHLVGISGGDARAALNVLESAVAMAGNEPSLEDIETAAQQRVLAYDRAGDGHYDTVSAFIKSIRGNDPDAALYWLAAMVAAGEDPRFIARRLIIVASEDIGNADPRGLEIAVAAAQALDWVGLPEAQYALAQATAYLAAAPKSNRAGLAYWAAMGDVLGSGSLPVPLHLRNAPIGRMKAHGIGIGYRYPHDFEGADVAQQYLPDALAERRYYVPSTEGIEGRIGERLERLRGEREAAGEKPRPRSKVDLPKVDPMRTAGGVMKTRQGKLAEIATKQKADAG
ncbi:MAG: replication-associated recombination protein A [Candidatus Limnocylindrales bacterium]